MSNENKVVELLKNEAIMNPVFNAVCHVFALRQRTRYKITTLSLMASMKKEGFDYTKEQYTQVLKFLSTLGIGTLVTDAKKRIKALDNVKVTLQSIGKTALGHGAKVKHQTPAHKYSQIAASVMDVAATAIPADPKRESTIKRSKPATSARQVSYPTFLTVVIDGRLVSFPSKEVEPDDLGDFLVKFKKLSQEPSV